MFERFTGDARKAVLLAAEEASTRRGDSRVGTEHLLLAAVEVDDSITRGLGLSAEDLRSRLVEWDERALQLVGIDASVESINPPPHPTRRRRFLLRGHTPFNRAAKRALKRSLHICLAEGHRAITVAHLLAALAIGGGNDSAVRLLRWAGVEPAELDAAIRRLWHAA